MENIKNSKLKAIALVGCVVAITAGAFVVNVSAAEVADLNQVTLTQTGTRLSNEYPITKDDGMEMISDPAESNLKITDAADLNKTTLTQTENTTIEYRIIKDDGTEVILDPAELKSNEDGTLYYEETDGTVTYFSGIKIVKTNVNAIETK